ncbi:MAG: acetyl-CoA acetyltransferase [Alphaproteobacteria bacterium]|nr:MAG: acetyl-CoA acetyltransferase [Alphaproteobacteria bacterium]
MSYLAEIPYGAYWSTPFCRWQGSFANLHSIKFAAHVVKAEMTRRDMDGSLLDYGVLGTSVPQHHVFYGLPWLTGMAGLDHVGGPTIGQACATSVRCILNGAQEIETGQATASLIVAADRVSNGPQVYYPNPAGPGGTGKTENWTMDNFGFDPLGGHSMLATAENVARDYNITTGQQHEVVLRRQEQYEQALADDHAFQKRFMTLPFDVPRPNFKKTANQLTGDEGLVTSTAEGLAGLRTVVKDGSITFGGQTHPADGNAALIVATPDKAKELSTDNSIQVKILGIGQARVELAYMPKATVPAARMALAQAGFAIEQMDAVKTHNPFAVNDLFFAEQFGLDVMEMNNYGCSLIWGHPQGPMGLRGVIELIEELVVKGGGYGVFSGCAAGDTAMAIVIQVTDRK